jgi:hypothetical protein
MAQIAVSAEDLVRLGASLEEVSAFLVTLGQVSAVEPWAFGPGSAGDALQDVLGNWERYRLLLGRHLGALALGARTAGAAYIDVEAGLATRIGGPSP